MLAIARDLRDEADELYRFLGDLREDDWSRPTRFKAWTPWDVVAHLHFFDRMSLLALEDPEAFAARRTQLVEGLAAGQGHAELARREYGALDPAALREAWHESCLDLADKLGAADPRRRLPWFGPDMGVPMFTTARLMETWAHGQEIYDLMRVERAPTDRLRHVALIGVKTFGWSFANRGQQPPGPPPYVRLTAPSGEVWEWGEPSPEERVEGSALDFCQVVTQVRNVAETGLVVEGEVARQWMAIAQCFAGGPEDPPRPGERRAE